MAKPLGKFSFSLSLFFFIYGAEDRVSLLVSAGGFCVACCLAALAVRGLCCRAGVSGCGAQACHRGGFSLQSTDSGAQAP